MMASDKGTALVADGSTGIGVSYADRLARRGHDLILVSYDRQRLEPLAGRLGDETGRSVKVINADLTDRSELARVEEILREDKSITILVNNAGTVAAGSSLGVDANVMEQVIALNVTALVQLTYSVAPAFIRQGGGAIINVASSYGAAPHIPTAVQGGFGAFVLAFSLSLQKELAGSNIHVQVVLPSAITTNARRGSGSWVAHRSAPTRDAGTVVDAAFAGFDRGELVTFPALPEIADRSKYEAMRQKMISRLLLGASTARVHEGKCPTS